MSDQTPLLSLPLIQAAQAQKHVTHNEAIEQLDMVVQLTVEAVDAITPPSGAAEGQAWAVGDGATGVWAGRAGQIAAWRGNGWLFAVPQTGWRAWNKSAAAIYAFDGNAWVYAAGTPDLQNLVTLGINATADATNRFAVSSDATLLTHGGTGHQLKINKSGETNTASLLYQTNWSGRAEMGLNGNDDFSVKVSADGSNFTDAIAIDAATGAVRFPAGTAGSGSAAGVMGLQTLCFTCERNGNASPGSYLSFGNGSSNHAGATMPFSGHVIAASLSQRDPNAGLNTVSLTINDTDTSGYEVAINADGTGSESSFANFASAPLAFAAGDRLAMKVIQSTSANMVGCFFVAFS